MTKVVMNSTNSKVRIDFSMATKNFNFSQISIILVVF